MRRSRLNPALPLIFALLLVLLGQHPPVFADSPQQRAIDPAKSTAHFSIAHVFVERVTGAVPIQRGSVTLAVGTLIPLSVSAVLDATKLDSGDPDRDGDLESADYFETAKYPAWTFESTKVVATDANTCSMDGMLTIHGVTQAEHLDVSIRGDAAHPIYHASGHIDRHAFGMRGARLDPAIGNVADVTLDIVLK